jgi:hypothetical protein
MEHKSSGEKKQCPVHSGVEIEGGEQRYLPLP